MHLSDVVAPLLGVLGGLLIAWITGGSAKTRRQRAVKADLDMLAVLPDDHPRRADLEKQVDGDLAVYLRRSRLTAGLNNQVVVIIVGLALIAVGLAYGAIVADDGALGAFVLSAGVVLVIRGGVNLLS